MCRGLDKLESNRDVGEGTGDEAPGSDGGKSSFGERRCPMYAQDLRELAVGIELGQKGDRTSSESLCWIGGGNYGQDLWIFWWRRGGGQSGGEPSNAFALQESNGVVNRDHRADTAGTLVFR